MCQAERKRGRTCDKSKLEENIAKEERKRSEQEKCTVSL